MKIGVCISGRGRTLENLLKYFPISVVVSSNPSAKGLLLAKNAYVTEDIFEVCKDMDLICLAGWIKKVVVPEEFKNRIMNIHPSLLPSFGGQGFYGLRVHEAVLKRGCKISGCTVHFVDNEYDNGPIIVQKAVDVLPNDTPETLAERVFQAECIAYPQAIEIMKKELKL